MTTTTNASPWNYLPAASPTRFEETPLITMDRIKADPFEAFAIVPQWVRSHTILPPDDHHQAEYDPVWPVVFVYTGHKRVTVRAYSAINFALLCELTRLPGISITTNGNGLGNYYARITIADAGEDLTSVNRFLWGAGPYDQIKVNGICKVDARPENLRADPAAKIGKDARSILMGHVERIAKDWEERGGMPDHFTRGDYLANLWSLIEATDLEAVGIEVDPKAGR